jgi:hypothetical protein
VVGFQLDNISYDETRFLNAHIDYKLKTAGGPYVQHLSQLPGHYPSVYKQVSGDGAINLEDDSVHQIKMEVTDANGNTALLKFGIKRGLAKPIHAADPGSLHQAAIFHPGFVNVFDNDRVRFYLAEQQLYDSIRFTYKEWLNAKGNTVYQLHTGNVPVHGYYTVQVKAPFSSSPKIIRRTWNGKEDVDKALYHNGWYKASFRAFGNFELLTDSTPPSITPVGFKNGMNVAKLNRLAFVIKDESDELRNFRAELDGKWLCFSNDKGRTFIYKFDEHCPPGEHELKISVQDVAGNKTIRIYQFTR